MRWKQRTVGTPRPPGLSLYEVVCLPRIVGAESFTAQVASGGGGPDGGSPCPVRPPVLPLMLDGAGPHLPPLKMTLVFGAA